MAPCSPVEAASPAAHRPGRDVLPAVIGPQAAHMVMLRRRHRDRLTGGVDSSRQAGRCDIGKFFGERRADGLGRVEKGAAPGLQFGKHAARDDVARRQFGVLV